MPLRRRASVLGLLGLLVSGSAHAAPACVSRYWKQLDAFCASPAQATASELPAASQQLRARCQPGAASELASGSVAERERELAAAAASLNVELGPSTEMLELAAADYIGMLSERLAPDSALQTGAGTDLLVSELLRHLCGDAGVRAWLSHTCNEPPQAAALLELRKRLLLDLVTLPRRAAERDGRLTAASTEVRASVALASAALSADPLWTLAQELAPHATCNAAELSLPPAAAPWGRAAQLIERLLADGAKLEQSEAYYELLLRKELQRLRSEPELSAATLADAKVLLQTFERIQRAGLPRTVEALQARLTELVKLVQAALRVVSAEPHAVQIPSVSIELVQAALRGELDTLVSRALGFTQQLAGPGLPRLSPQQVRAVETAVRFALARDEDEAKRIVRGLVIPLGRWSESVLFDLNGDIPSLERGSFRVVGDALLGYNGKSWGIVGQGALAEYDFSTAEAIAETTTADGGFETWVVGSVGHTRRVKLGGRLFGKAALYDTNHSGSNFSDETSIMARGGLLASVRYQPGERFAGGLWLGAGAQYEWYDSGDFFAGQRADLETIESLGLLLNARARLELAIVPRWLVSRLRVDAQRYALTRKSLATVAAMGSTSTSATQLSAQQIELRSRLFLDAEVARFAGFVPSVNVGFDSVFFISNSESHQAIVPVFGAGIRRDAF